MSEPPATRASFSLLRRWGIALNVTLSAAALLALVVMVNYLGSRHYRRADLSARGAPGLSPLTRQFLATLTNDVRVTVLFDPEESALYTEVRSLLTEYQLACRRLQIDYVNYGRNPGRAEVVKAQYRLATSPDTLTVIFDAPGRPPRVVRERELSDYDVAGALQGAPMRRTSFKGEQYFTSALLSVADARPLRAFYLTGHGEVDVGVAESPDGYHQFALLLAEKNIELRPLTLRTNGVPEEAELLVVAGPRQPLPADELQKIEQYLQRGGRALFLLYSTARPGVRRTGLERVLAGYGVDLGEALVMDRTQAQAGDTRVLLTDQLGLHPITNPLEGSRLGFVMPCAVWPRRDAARAGSASVSELAKTSPAGMVVSTGRGSSGTVESTGVIPLAVAVEKGTIAGVSPDRGTTRLVVVGEASFLGNTLIDFEANRDFAGLAVNWLLDRRQLLDIGPRPVREYRINLTRRQLQTTAWILLGGLPGSVLLLGLFVWMRRRK